MNNKRIGIFRDKEDLTISLSDNNIVNITGMTGSGKSTLGKELASEKGYELLNFDWIFGYGYDKDKISNRIRQIMNDLQVKYPETQEKDFFRWRENKKENEKIKERYNQYVIKFYQYIVNNIEFNIIIEGIQLLEHMDVKDLKGDLIIKRTSLFNCYIRAFKRDVCACYKSYKSGEMNRKKLIDKIIERVKIPISSYQQINRYMKLV